MPKYQTEILFHACSEREFTMDNGFDDLQAAVDWLSNMSKGHMIATGYINNVKVMCYGGRVVGKGGDVVCTNEAWHEIFAPRSERILPNPAMKGFDPMEAGRKAMNDNSWKGGAA